jgi:hypothetical protein
VILDKHIHKRLMVVAIKEDSSCHCCGLESERIFVDILMTTNILINFIKIRHSRICTY